MQRMSVFVFIVFLQHMCLVTLKNYYSLKFGISIKPEDILHLPDRDITLHCHHIGGMTNVYLLLHPIRNII